MQGRQARIDKNMIDNITMTQWGPSGKILEFAYENTSKIDYFILTFIHSNGK